MKQLLDDHGVHLWQFQWPAERLQEQAGRCPENSSIDDIIAGDRGTSHLLTASHQLWGRHKNQLRLWGGELHGLPQLLMANITVILGACRIRSFIFLFFPLRIPPDEKDSRISRNDNAQTLWKTKCLMEHCECVDVICSLPIKMVFPRALWCLTSGRENFRLWSFMVFCKCLLLRIFSYFIMESFSRRSKNSFARPYELWGKANKPVCCC